MDNYVKITRLLYLQTEAIKATRRVAGTPATIASLFFSRCNRSTGELPAEKDSAERAGRSGAGGEECGVDGTNGGSSEG